MKRKTRKQKGRGLLQSKPQTIKSVQFNVNKNTETENNLKSWNRPGYLEDLKSVLDRVIPPVANLHCRRKTF